MLPTDGATMVDQSVVRRSGQWWKMVAGFSALIAGGIVLYDGIANRHLGEILIALAIEVTSAVITCLAVRCPRCRDPWVWRAARTIDVNALVPWLVSLRACPVCGDDGRTNA
jgi:hypothetical protein